MRSVCYWGEPAISMSKLGQQGLCLTHGGLSYFFAFVGPPTHRAALQTVDMERRLMRGGELHVGNVDDTMSSWPAVMKSRQDRSSVSSDALLRPCVAPRCRHATSSSDELEKPK
jgi:hypothetical protein